jgi:hypothetical protein
LIVLGANATRFSVEKVEAVLPHGGWAVHSACRTLERASHATALQQ